MGASPCQEEKKTTPSLTTNELTRPLYSLYLSVRKNFLSLSLRLLSMEAAMVPQKTAGVLLSNVIATATLKEEAGEFIHAAEPATGAVHVVAVIPVVHSSLDEHVKDANGELIHGGFKRGGAENGPDGVYDEVELEDLDYDVDLEEYSYPCPCGDRFRICKDDMLDGEDIARCASCSLLLRVIYDPEDLEEDD
jgi:diphthamide biosynthesis protein 3